MTESDRKECLQLLIEYAQTKTLILDERQKQLLKQFSEYFEIPYRTVKNWKSGSRKCPDYVLKLILYRLENENEKRGE